MKAERIFHTSLCYYQTHQYTYYSVEWPYSASFQPKQDACLKYIFSTSGWMFALNKTSTTLCCVKYIQFYKQYPLSAGKDYLRNLQNFNELRRLTGNVFHKSKTYNKYAGWNNLRESLDVCSLYLVLTSHGISIATFCLRAFFGAIQSRPDCLCLLWIS